MKMNTPRLHHIVGKDSFKSYGMTVLVTPLGDEDEDNHLCRIEYVVKRPNEPYNKKVGVELITQQYTYVKVIPSVRIPVELTFFETRHFIEEVVIHDIFVSTVLPNFNKKSIRAFNKICEDVYDIQNNRLLYHDKLAISMSPEEFRDSALYWLQPTRYTVVSGGDGGCNLLTDSPLAQIFDLAVEKAAELLGEDLLVSFDPNFYRDEYVKLLRINRESRRTYLRWIRGEEPSIV